MLTADLAMSWQRGSRITPRAIAADDPTYLRTAEDLIFLFSQHQDQTRAELEQALDEYVGTGTDYRILRGLIKLLLDRCEFATVSAREPAQLRQALFFRAARQHPVLTDAERQQVISAVAEELECTTDDVINGLYADLPARQRLTSFAEPGVRELLERYNLAQAQALLYRCTEMRLTVAPQEPAATRQLFTEIKSFRLIHTIRGNARTGYEIRLSGPVSLFHRSQKYGIQMAVFLPALLLCSGWQMRAEISTKNGTAFYELDSAQQKLRSHYLLEEITADHPQRDRLLAAWDKAESEWTISACRDVIDLGETTFVPDLVFTHASGKQIWLELIGYWTPRYLRDRLQEFERRRFHDFLFAVSAELQCSREGLPALPPGVLLYKTSLAVKDVRQALEDKGPQ